MNKNVIFFKNIKFYNYSFIQILKKIKFGGYVVAPAASSLSRINNNKKYYEALKNSTVAIFDSGFFCALLFLFKGIKVRKFSGYLFLKKLINNELKNKKVLSIDPSKKESFLNKKYFQKNKIKSHSYIAPFYKKNYYDERLFTIIKQINVDYIIINIAGEKQEILAYELHKKFKKKKLKIICTGAAIAFLTGSQTQINDTIDKLYLGWFFRFISNPKVYYKRVLNSLFLLRFFI
jgi:N-acetylglucosaminyldiphosphoundecaprenol N-acetyl-beta-D-mannosaminyltransferase